MNDYGPALAAAVVAARAAGEILRREFHWPGGPRGQGSQADSDGEAERVIRERLHATGDWPYRRGALGEAPGADSSHLWLVDANGDTEAYLRGHRGTAVAIAALRDGVPVLGVVHAFSYPDGDGDLIAWAEGCDLTRNGRIVRTDLSRAFLYPVRNPPPVVFVSYDADRAPAANAECVRPARYVAIPSIAYRLARVAAGDGVAAVSLDSPRGWNYAAGHALLLAAGGELVDEDGKAVVYARDGGSSVRRCFGGAPGVAAALARRDWRPVFRADPDRPPPFCLLRPEPGRAVADVGLLARAQGCLLGQLAGDSLGGLVEFLGPEEIQSRHPDGVRDLRDGGTWYNLAGQPTDDSEMALVLARTLAHRRRYEPGAVLDAYARWWPRAWDRGSTLMQALGAASRGRDTAERQRLAGEYASRSSQSNGCLMRASPLGVFGAGRPEEAAALAWEDAGLTHPNPVCRGACAAFVAAVAAAVGGATPAECHAAALAEADRRGAPDGVRGTLDAARERPPADYVSRMGWILIALQNAFHQLFHAPNLEEGVVDTVMRGGDTDTNAAIAGALLGAVHGREAIPTRWRSALLSCRPLEGAGSRHPQPPEYWPVDALELAEALLWAGSTDARPGG